MVPSPCRRRQFDQQLEAQLQGYALFGLGLIYDNRTLLTEHWTWGQCSHGTHYLVVLVAKVLIRSKKQHSPASVHAHTLIWPTERGSALAAACAERVNESCPPHRAGPALCGVGLTGVTPYRPYTLSSDRVPIGVLGKTLPLLSVCKYCGEFVNGVSAVSPPRVEETGLRVSACFPSLRRTRPTWGEKLRPPAGSWWAEGCESWAGAVELRSSL
eukprot:scaffold4735_cov403-Prasinococcus_capsulatus_cf.AAC.14